MNSCTGDVTNWMNQTSGEFNYTGLVTNMELKAGSFYGMKSLIELLDPLYQFAETQILMLCSRVPCFLGLDLRQH
jgi:hypothetical protein